MKQRLQLERSRLLGFRLSQESDRQASNDVRIGAKIGKPLPEIVPAPRATQARAYFDARIGAKIGKGAVSDVRLKRDITLVALLKDALGLYRYRYLWSDTVYVGVMAQEVALIHPEAVVRSALDKYLRVDYSRLGLKLMTWSEWESKRAKL